MQLSRLMMKKYHTFFQQGGVGGRELAGFPLLPSFPMILGFSPTPHHSPPFCPGNLGKIHRIIQYFQQLFGYKNAGGLSFFWRFGFLVSLWSILFWHLLNVVKRHKMSRVKISKSTKFPCPPPPCPPPRSYLVLCIFRAERAWKNYFLPKNWLIKYFYRKLPPEIFGLMH